MTIRKRIRKHYYVVVAPQLFNSKEVGYIISKNPDNLIGRSLEVPLSSLTDNPLHLYMKCKLRIVGVDNGKALSAYNGHEYYREYVRSLFMRGSTYVDIIRELETDKRRYRILVGIFTTKRISTSRKKAIRKVGFKTLNRWHKREDDYFVRDAVYGVIDSYIAKASKRIYPIRWCGIIKVKGI